MSSCCATLESIEVDSELVVEYMYMQTFQRAPNGEKDATDVSPIVSEYSKDMINDPGVLEFYKSVNHSTADGYVICFYAFTATQLDAPDLVHLRDKYLPMLKPAGLILHSEQILTQLHGHKRKPVHTGEKPKRIGWGSIEGNSCFKKFLNWWLIVPKVQWHFFNLLYQIYTFDITHQGFLPKFVHFFTIPCNVMLSMYFLAQFGFFGLEKHGYGAFELNGGLILLIILVIRYLIAGFLRKTVVWGLATVVVLFACWITGNLWYAVYKNPENPWYNPTTIGTNPLMWSYIISFIQAGSHTLVPQLPPFITGFEHWESLHTFFCRKYESTTSRMTSACFIVMSLLCFPILSVAVAWFSWPHLIGTEVIYIMAGIGYQHSSFQKIFRVIEKAELSGNPGLDQFPKTSGDLTQTPVARKLRQNGIISDNASSSDVAEAICSVKLVRTYFKAATKNDDSEHMKFARHQMHYD